MRCGLLLGTACWGSCGYESLSQDGVWGLCQHLLRPSLPFLLLPREGESSPPHPCAEPTSGWNCCSVRVWQYWQASPFSHLPGSPHSSPCFTLGHGDDLVQREGGSDGRKRDRLGFGGCQLDPCSGPLSGLPASRGQKPGSAALAQPGCTAEDTVYSRSRVLPPSAVPPKAAATSTLPRPGPSASEPKGPQRLSGPRFTWQRILAGHPSYPAILESPGRPPRLPERTGEAALPRAQPRQPHRRGRPAWAGDLYLCFRGLRRRSLLLW